MSREKDFDDFVKIVDNNNYIKQKNTMLVHLADRSIWNLFNKTFKDSIDRKPTDDSLSLFIKSTQNLNIKRTYYMIKRKRH